MSLSIPKIYADRYELKQAIGEGAFSHTYLAYDRVLQRDVALKILRREHVENDESAARFDREAQAAAQISHPNVVPVFDFGLEQNLPFIVMQYIDGRTLRQFDREEGPLTIEEIVSIGKQVLDGLAAIHDQGIIHRDVKPQNVLLDNRMVARLTDFGVAYLTADPSLTDVGTTIGTAAYMAPEQATGQTIGPGADLYSTGVMLYELLTSRLPFRGDNPVQIMYRHVSDLPQRPRDLNPRIPHYLEAAILRSLSKIPSERYSNARAMRDALTRSNRSHAPLPTPVESVRATPDTFNMPTPTPNQSEPTHQSPATTPEPVPRRPTKLRLTPLIVAFAVVVLAAVAVAFALQGLDNNGNNPDDSAIGLASTTEVPSSGGIPPATEPAVADSPTTTVTASPENQPNATEQPEEDNPASAPTVAFNTPFPVSAVPPRWMRGRNAVFGRDQFVAGGAYVRDDGTLYGRPAAHLYSRQTDFERTSVSFTVNQEPSQYIGVVIRGMDDELPALVNCRLLLNDVVVWEGPSPFGNEIWTQAGWELGNVTWLHPGENTLSFEVLSEEGEVGLPPWILLTEATVYWD